MSKLRLTLGIIIIKKRPNVYTIELKPIQQNLNTLAKGNYMKCSQISDFKAYGNVN